MSMMDQKGLGGPKPSGGGLVRIAQVEAESELDSFIYMVSHDLRNCARALTEVPQWLHDDIAAQGVKFSPDVKENFELLDRHAKRLDRMLLDLLVFSRIGRMQEVSTFSLKDLLENVLSECPLPEHVTLQIDGDLPDVSIGYQDCFVLFKCVLDNVIKHGRSKDSILKLRAHRRRSEVTLTFSDNGPGIAQTDIQRIFKPMTTLKRRDEVEASGMGLAIIRRISDHYRGEVWAGGGAEDEGFRMRIRLRDAVDATL